MEGKVDSEEPSKDFELLYVKGFPFLVSYKYKKENILSAMNYSPLDDDTIICSYPKTGITWVQYTLIQILYKMKRNPSFYEMNGHDSPYMEMVGAEVAERLPSPRLIKFHLPYHLTPRNNKAKYIYTIRNPKDTFVSYYYFSRGMKHHSLSLDEYFNRFMNGKVSFGDYFDHLLSWYEHKDDKNLLLVHYEDLSKDARSQTLRIAEFLGENHLKALQEDTKLVDAILEKTSFSNMKKSLSVPVAFPEVDKTSSADGTSSVNGTPSSDGTMNFFRKGTTGDWRNHLTLEQSRILDEKIQEKLGHTDLISKWRTVI